VQVTVGTLNDGFFVEDTGPGIPIDDREKVFEEGFSTRGSGTGLGLSVVLTVATAHEWDIQISEAETGGARFEITGVEFAE
jgi:signal transduction histidine kinase